MTERRTRTGGRGRIPPDARGAEATAERIPLPPSHAQLLALQRSAGNQAVASMLQREPAAAAAPAADEMAKEAMRADVEIIVGLLGSQVLFAGEEQQIVDIFRRRLESDRQAGEHGGAAGTPLLNEFIQMLRRRVFPRSTARTGWIESWVNAWDTLFYELEDERLEEFKAIVGQSGNPAAARGPEGANSENLWSTMGEQEAIGMLGTVKGLSTGAAGVLDLAGWAMVKQANMTLDPLGKAIGFDLTLSAPEIAKQVGEGFDFMGDAAFGKDKFSGGESLLGGMNAAQIGNLGGGIIWSLTMAGAGGQAQAGSQAKALLTGIDVLGKIKSVEDGATSMLAYLARKKKEGPITWAALRDDPTFWIECTKVAQAIAGAIAMGIETKDGAAATVKKVLETATPYLKAGEIGAKVARIVEILNDEKLPPEKKEAEAGQVVGELVATAFDLLGNKAVEADTARAKAAADAAAGGSAPAPAPEAGQAAPERDPLDFDIDVVEPAAAATAAAAAPPSAAPHVEPDLRPEPKSAETQAELHGSLDAQIAGIDDAFREVDQPHGPVQIFEIGPGPKPGAGGGAPPPVPEANVSPERLRSEFGMPEGNQEKFASIAEKHGVEIDVRPTNVDAPALLEQGAVPKIEDLKVKTISHEDLYLGARPEDLGKVGFFMPEPPAKPAGMSDAEWAEVKPHADARFRQREAEFWEYQHKMQELQSRPENQDGTYGTNQAVIGPGGVVSDISQRGDQLMAAPFSGDHDIFDIRNADGTPIAQEKYEAIIAEMKAAGMGVAHGAHMKWVVDPADGVNKAIFDKIVARHASGQELLIRFAPSTAPATANPR